MESTSAAVPSSPVSLQVAMSPAATIVGSPPGGEGAGAGDAGVAGVGQQLDELVGARLRQDVAGRAPQDQHRALEAPEVVVEARHHRRPTLLGVDDALPLPDPPAEPVLPDPP